MKALTKTQQKVLDFINSYRNKNGYPPTRREIGDALGFSSENAAQEHLVNLEKHGAISLTRGISRGIRLIGGVHA